jgi:hypothetical protein
MAISGARWVAMLVVSRMIVPAAAAYSQPMPEMARPMSPIAA